MAAAKSANLIALEKTLFFQDRGEPLQLTLSLEINSYLLERRSGQLHTRGSTGNNSLTIVQACRTKISLHTLMRQVRFARVIWQNHCPYHDPSEVSSKC